MAFELLDRDGYLELRMFGVVDGTTVLTEPELKRFAANGRLLVNTVDVTSVTADVMWMAGLVRRAFSHGPIRVAVLAGDDVVFGTFRQVSAYRGESPEGSSVDFFRDQNEALGWLLAPG
jgi:hypothetical protein